MRVARRIFLGVLLVVILVCLAPLAAYLWSEWAAERWGCDFGLALSQGGCVVDGVDRAPVLMQAYSAVALLVVTLPVAFIASLAALIVLARRPQHDEPKEPET
ncbi:hypothetical protein BXY66_2099 [Shimia isoporae]|uniref:Uncharacterized protein n=1 Tax=Shimia isoporae TaxID=647720 RepID=A0A4R1NQC8_9RHOB|nr:hypothetical protein [Shimia isoporae]TCL10031.1 hypothetical protein BXY66_2099 [Shimia isoporae]